MAALFAALFVAGTAVLIVAVMWIVADTQQRTLEAENDVDLKGLQLVFQQEGIAETIEVVRQRLGDPQHSVRPSGISMSLQDAEGAPLAGNMPHMPSWSGEFEFDSSASTSLAPPRSALLREDPSVLGKAGNLGSAGTLYVGRDTTILIATRDKILQAFLWVMLGAILVAVGGGVLLAKRLSQRVDAVISTCEGIIAGRFDERIPVRGTGSEWDTLARAINEMLNRIALLLDNLRQVSSDVAHDLRTPLARMRNRLEEARTRSVSIAEYSSAVDQAIEDTDQLLALFAALLRISQVEAGTRLSSFAKVSVSELLGNVRDFYRPLAEDRQHRLDADIGAGLEIQGDAELLFQLFSNLIENAIRHTPAGTNILIEGRPTPEGIKVVVHDDGPGIPEQEFPKITRRFYRLSSSRSEPGNGLGLALVSAIASLHGARMAFLDGNPGLSVRLLFSPTGSAASS